MDPALLRAFLAVVDERHFRRAAARLQVAPSTLSQQISRLEQLAGTRLLNRHPVELTEAGDRFVGAARDLVAAADGAARRIDEIRSHPGARLRIGVLSHGAGPRMAQLIRTYRAARPDVRVSLVSLAFSSMASALLDGDVDVAFIRPALDDPRFDEYPILSEQRHVILPSHDERAHLTSLALRDLDRDTFLTPSSGTPFRYEAFLHLLDDRNDEPPRRCDTSCEHAEEFLTAVAAGLGIATTVTSFTQHYRWPGIAYVPLDDAKPAATTAIVRHDERRSVVHDFAALLAA